MLVSCVAYEDGKKLADISVEAISDYLLRPNACVWVALSQATEAELAQMQDEFDLHPLAMEDARHGHQRPKIEEFGDDLFAALHVPQSTPQGEIVVGEVMLFVGKNYVLSVRRDVEPGFASVRARCEREPEVLRHGSGYIFYALMDAIVDRYFPILEGLEIELEKLEARIFSRKRVRSSIQDLYRLKQKLVTLRHAVVPLMEATGKLQAGRVPHVCGGLTEYFRDVYDHLNRINAAADDLREMITTALNVNLSMSAAESGETGKKLAAWAAMLAAPTVMAGIWGMNFKHMPELDWAYGYPMALLAIASVVGYLYYRFKRSGWL